MDQVCSFSARGLCSTEHSSLFVGLFGYTKLRTLSEVGKHAMCTYHVRGENSSFYVSHERERPSKS